MSDKKGVKKDDQGVPEPEPGELDRPGPVDGFALWDVGAPPSNAVGSKDEGLELLWRHVHKSGEVPGDVRLVKVKEVKVEDGDFDVDRYLSRPETETEYVEQKLDRPVETETEKFASRGDRRGLQRVADAAKRRKKDKAKK